jgi:hypothetical protein
MSHVQGEDDGVGYGVWGRSQRQGYEVIGESDGDNGVWGKSDKGTGVVGYSNSGVGVSGGSGTHYGIYGESGDGEAGVIGLCHQDVNTTGNFVFYKILFNALSNLSFEAKSF